MLVGQRVFHRLDQGLESQDLVGHLVHGILHTGTVVLSEGLKSDITSSSPGSVELGNVGLDFIKIAEALELPIGVDIGAENAIPCFGESGVLITDEAPELGVGALKNCKAMDGRVDVNTLALGHIHLHVSGFLAVPVERVWVRLAVDVQTGPAVGDDVNVRNVDVVVFLDEVGAEDGTEELRGSYWVLLCENVDGVFDRIGGDDDAVVSLCVAVQNICISFDSFRGELRPW